MGAPVRPHRPHMPKSASGAHTLLQDQFNPCSLYCSWPSLSLPSTVNLVPSSNDTERCVVSKFKCLCDSFSLCCYEVLAINKHTKWSTHAGRQQPLTIRAQAPTKLLNVLIASYHDLEWPCNYLSKNCRYSFVLACNTYIRCALLELHGTISYIVGSHICYIIKTKTGFSFSLL